MSQDLLAHRMEGEGSPVLLLNGGMMTFASWEPVAVHLRERHSLLLCDFRGQLMSPGPSHRELEGNLADLLALLDHLTLEKVHVIGTSFGSEVALLLASEHPDRVRSLIAVTVTDHTTPVMEESTRQMLRLVREIRDGGDGGKLHDRLVEGVYSPRFLDANRETLSARRDQVASLPDSWFEGLEGILTAVGRFDLRPRLSGIRCPTLIVTAAHDRALPAERGRAVTTAIPGAELTEHPTSGHALVVEDPVWLAKRCLEFIDRF